MKTISLSRLTALVMILAFGAFGCASTGTAPTEGEMATKTDKAAEKSQPMDSGEILQVLQTINEAEINHSQLALQRSQNPEVIETAEKVIRDHRALNQRIDQIAQETNSELKQSPLSEGLKMQASQIENQLTDLSGEQFDREYLRRQIQLHELSIETAREDLMPSATDAQVRQLLTEASDHLQMHLKVAEQSYQELQDSAVGGGPEDQMQPGDVESDDMDHDDMDHDEMDNDMMDPQE